MLRPIYFYGPEIARGSLHKEGELHLTIKKKPIVC